MSLFLFVLGVGLRAIILSALSKGSLKWLGRSWEEKRSLEIELPGQRESRARARSLGT